MQPKRRSLNLPNLEQVLEQYPLTVAPDTLLSEAIASMNQTQERSFQSSQNEPFGATNEQTNKHEQSTYVLVVAQGKVVGIFTERDLVRLVASQTNLSAITMAEAMTQPVITIKSSECQNILSVWSCLRQHSLRYLPVLDEQEKLLGVVTLDRLLQVFEPLDLEQLEMSDDVSKREQELTDFVENAAIGLHWVGADGEILWANQAELDLLGYEREEYIGHHIAEFHADRDVIEDFLSKLSNKETLHHYEARLRCKDGSIRYVLINSNVLWQDGKFVHTRCFTQDITACKRAELELKQERDFVAAVLNTVGALIVVLDQQGRIIRFNHTSEHVTGYSADEVRYRCVWDFLLTSAEEKTVKAIFAQLLTGQVPNQYENHWLTKDGSRRLISWSNTALFNPQGEVEYIIATGIDITEQRQVQAKQEHQYRQTQLLAEVTRKIRFSIELEEILSTTVTEVQHLLACDRVMIVELQSNGTAIPISEAILPGFPPMLGYELADPLMTGEYLERYRQGDFFAISNLQTAVIEPEIKQLLQQFAIQAKLVVPILSHNQLEGLLVAHQCTNPRQWQKSEIELLQQLADQIGVALSQAQLLDNLEELVRERTAELTGINQQLKAEIDQHQLTEAALRESEQKFAGILDHADEAIISVDEQQKIQLFNQGAEKIFGYAATEVLGQSLDILLPEVFREIHRQHTLSFRNSINEAHGMAERISKIYGRRKNGKEFPAEASISKLYSREGLIFTVMLKDITERQQAEAALRRSEEQLRLITNALPILIAYVDTEQRYHFNNQAYENWFGKTLAEIEGCHIWEVIGETTYQQIRPYVETVLSGKLVTFELQVNDKDSNPHWVNVNYIPDFDRSRKVKGFFAAIHDISDRKAVEQMKSEFVSVASHEMRTPLTSIHGVLKLLAAGRLGYFSEQGKEMIKIALRNTDRLARLINDVLDLERIESGREAIKEQHCNSAELIQQAAATMGAMAQQHKVTIEVNAIPIKLWADPDHIIQILTNLLSNAIKFSPPNSTVWVNVEPRNDKVLFSVKDQGRGIPANKLETIFERFQQVDASDSRQKGGTGLGLAICRHIVEQYRGSIWVESIIGKGSTFYFYLPVDVSS